MAHEATRVKGRGRPGRPGKLSVDRIVEEACQIPLDELSFPRVAQRLEVSPQALYKYFANVDELRSELAERMGSLSGHDYYAGSEQPFSVYLRQVFLEFRAWVEQNELSQDLFKSEYGTLQFRDGGPSNHLAQLLDAFLAHTKGYGIADADALDIWCVITDFLGNTGAFSLPDSFDRDMRRAMSAAAERAGDGSLRYLREAQTSQPLSDPEARDFYVLTADVLIAGICARYGID